MAPPTAAQEALRNLPGLTQLKDRTGLIEELQQAGKKDPGSHDFRQNSTLHLANACFASESPRLSTDHLNPTATTAEQQGSTLKGPCSPAANLNPRIPSASERNEDIIASIHVTIEDIKSVQKDLKKKWYYIDQNEKQVDVEERMSRILRGVEGCAKIMDVTIKYHSEISSLVLAGTKFILMVGHISGFFFGIGSNARIG